MFFTSDPENLKAMLATQFEDFDLGPVRRGTMLPSLGDGIFVQDGKAWEHSRAMLRPNFVREQISDLELEETHVQELLQVMPVRSDGWTAMTDIQTLFFRLTLDSACEFLFGESVGSQLFEAGLSFGSQEPRVNFGLHFDRAMMHVAKRFRYGDLYWLHNPSEFRSDNKMLNDFISHYVDLALERPIDKKSGEDGLQGGGARKYVFLEALAEQNRNPEELRAQLLNILLAGRDTTASLLSWFFHQLLRNPEVFTKLRSVILETFGTYEKPQDITFASLKGCQYLQYCLNETLRLRTVVPGNLRRSNKATTLPRGGGPDGIAPVYIRPNTDVTYSIHVMMRREDLWGPDAKEFNPERWAGRRPGWEFLPFNGGPRICIGQQFAVTEASYVVVRLLQRFDKIETTTEELLGEVRSAVSLTSCPARKVKLRLREARD